MSIFDRKETEITMFEPFFRLLGSPDDVKHLDVAIIRANRSPTVGLGRELTYETLLNICEKSIAFLAFNVNSVISRLKTASCSTELLEKICLNCKLSKMSHYEIRPIP
uniref:Uncharacterized protein n=1 Tax=Romanomermis culicivorax TaxID=13658 RepID=A0A915IBM3_ROMCU